MNVKRRTSRSARVLVAVFFSGVAFAPAATVAASPSPAATRSCPCPAKAVLPVALSASEVSSGWALDFLTPPCPPVVELRVGVDGKKPVSLGREDTKDPFTHRPAARHTLLLAPELFGKKGEADGDRQLAVSIVRPGGRVDGPYELRFSPREERLAEAKLQLARSPRTYVSFAEHGSVYTWLGFHTLFGIRSSLREVRYSVNDCALGHRLVFSPENGVEPTADRGDEPTDLTFDRPFLTLLRETTSSACVQVVFADGTVSDVLELKRDAQAPPR